MGNNALGRIHRDEKVISYYCINNGSIFAGYLLKTNNHEGTQNNVATQIARNYDVNEIEFLSFSKNESTGSYILKIKINGDENKLVVMRFDNLNKLDDDTVDIGLNPPDKYKNIERKERITGKIDLSTIKIKYLE